jgi:hypothetical protein
MMRTHTANTLSFFMIAALFMGLAYTAYAQTEPTAPGPGGGLADRKDEITATTDCKTLYPDNTNNGGTVSNEGMRTLCEKIKAGGGDPTQVQNALQALDSTREGVYGCNGIAQYGPVGRNKAEGAYVPVNDSAVMMNTFILVNKVCVLDAVARNNRNALIAGLERAQIKAINEGGDGGRPQYPQDLMRLYRNEIPTRVMENILRSKEVQSMCSPMRDTLIRNAAQRFYTNQTNPANRIACTFKDQAKLKALYDGGHIDLVGWDGFQQSLQENNNPYLLNLAFNDYIDATTANEIERQKEELQNGKGFFSKKKCEQVPVGNGRFETQCKIVTPGSVIADSATYLSLSGNRLVESADEINKMVGTMFSNLASQILSSTTGFAGTTQSQNGQPSYLDGAVNSAYQAAQTETLTTGVEALQRALTIETTYVSIRTNSKKSLETAIAQVKNLQNTCVATLAAQAKIDLRKQVQDQECGAQVDSLNGTSCNVAVDVTEKTVEDVLVIDARGPTKRIVIALKAPDKATAIVTNTIQPMLDIVTTSLNNAQKGLALLKQLEASVRGASTPQLVAYVISQLNQLIQAKVLHGEAEVSSAREQQNKITDTMQNLIDRTKDQWESDWCKAEKWQALVVPTPASYK